MTSSRLFKVFAGLFAISAGAAVWLWHATGEPPDHTLVRFVVATLLATLVVGVVGADTRPRLMMRFLAALFALLALIAFAADISQPAVDGHSQSAISLLQHLQNLAPSLPQALEKSVTRSLGASVWDPLLRSILSLPASLIFLVLAVATGLAGRPRQRVRIFVNDV